MKDVGPGRSGYLDGGDDDRMPGMPDAGPPPPCPNCGRRLGRSFTQPGMFACLPCGQHFDPNDAALLPGQFGDLADTFARLAGRNGT